MRIETANGHTILADDADYPLLRDYSWYVVKWNGGLYAQARVRRANKRVSMHRLLMQPPRGFVVHHKNNNGLDNRRSNLEITTNRQNLRYHYDQRDDAGVHLDKRSGHWRAQRRGPDGKRISLGTYSSKSDAIAASNAFRESMS